jgi:hypothetical protein
MPYVQAVELPRCLNQISAESGLAGSANRVP